MSLRKELLHETRLLAAMSHPCILTLIGYTDEPAQIVLEVLDGTVYDLVRSGTTECDGGMLSPLLDILSGCAYLHARSPPVLHRDLKPPNVLHDERRRCKLCDFGTAIELHPNGPKPTEWVGSALYVAPEIDNGQPYGLPAGARAHSSNMLQAKATLYAHTAPPPTSHQAHTTPTPPSTSTSRPHVHTTPACPCPPARRASNRCLLVWSPCV